MIWIHACAFFAKPHIVFVRADLIGVSFNQNAEIGVFLKKRGDFAEGGDCVVRQVVFIEGKIDRHENPLHFGVNIRYLKRVAWRLSSRFL